MGDILFFRSLYVFLVSLVNFISREPKEYSVTRAKITQNARANFEPVNVAERICWEGCLKYAMLVGSN